MKRKTYLILAIGLIGLISLSTVAAITPSTGNLSSSYVAPVEYEDGSGGGGGGGGEEVGQGTFPGDPQVPDGLEPGDIIMLKTDTWLARNIMPGDWSHAGIFCGYVQPGEMIWDRDAKEWMDPGTPYVIHSTRGKGSGDGLGYSTWSSYLYFYGDSYEYGLYQVSRQGISIPAYSKRRAVSFLKSQLSGGYDGYPVGPRYDCYWLAKQVYGGGYYCSEAVWAAYYATTYPQINLDPDGRSGWAWDDACAVSPKDLVRSEYSIPFSGDSWERMDGYYC